VDEDRRQKWAEFRFEVIAPLLDSKLDGAEKARIRQAILREVCTTPDGKKRRISERTLRNWLNRFRTGQLKELENRGNKMRGQMKALDEDVLEAAKELRERMRTRSIQDICTHLKYSLNIDVAKISASTLNRHLNRVGATKEKNHSDKGAHQHYQKEHINQLWQSDCCDGLYLPDPLGLKEVRQTTLITFIDDCSRFCVHGAFYFSEQLVDLLDCMRTALAGRGCPSKILTDNGPIYKANDLRSICAEFGIELIHSEPKRPEGKGKQERHYLTIQTRFYKEAKKAGIETLAELNEFFWAWLDECYHKVEHSSLSKMTPLERWQQEEAIIERVSLEKIQQAMQLRSRRSIDFKTALIRLNGKRYQASQNLAGKRVQVRWPFDDHSAVNIYQNGFFVERAEQFIPGADIDYTKRPKRQREEEPRVLDCSKRLRLSLVARYQGEKAPEDISRFGVLTEREFVFVMEQSLDKSVGGGDLELLKQ
jgi:putative transposase